MSTTTTEQQKGQSKPEMTKMAYDFMANCYIYACQLRAKGHHTLAERLVTQALELDYEANFIKGAFSTPEFIDHLKNAFYASAKALECMRLIAAVDIKCDGHDDLVDSIETMKRMLRSSVVTMMNREKSGGSSKSSDSPVVSRYEPQEKHEYTPPRRAEDDDGGADKTSAEEDSGDDVLKEFQDADEASEAEPAAVSA
ncbi:MAG: hypothetical protein IK128_02925 [Clostridiales bacterium]|nr:hypothetical protein [Clostridiales bacterium]